MENNPYIEPENYYAGYQESIDKLKNNPEYVEFDKLVHMVFGTPDGKLLLEEIDKRFLNPALISPNNPNYQIMVIYTEGYKEAFRHLKSCYLSHDQRIKAELNTK
jgi:hypothetical protein